MDWTGQMPPIARLAHALARGTLSSCTLIDAALARIEDPAGEGKRAFRVVYGPTARARAAAADMMFSRDLPPSPIAGLPISVKDLFDIAGTPTAAGSRVFAQSSPASEDAPVIARLRQAGAIIVGRTNMTELAFSGLGLNPHFGTPRNPWDRALGRIPGGSSSGAAVSVADGMAAAAIGTDTGGSVRIPAALCGLAGFKPTAARIPRAGVKPLSPTLDSIGPIAASASCCAVLDAVMAGAPAHPPSPIPPAGRRFLAPVNLVRDGMDGTVSGTFAQALATLQGAGAEIVETALGALDDIPDINSAGGLPAVESYRLYGDLCGDPRGDPRGDLSSAGSLIDPRVKARIMRGASIGAADEAAIIAARETTITRAAAALAPFDALLMPTVPIVAPPLAPLEKDDALYAETNMLMLRNPSLINFLDGCALTLPCHAPDTPPVGITVAGMAGSDAHILALGLGIESALARANQRRMHGQGDTNSA